MDILKDLIFTDMISKMKISNEIKYSLDKSKIIFDFIFLCYLCGNDFIPNIPSITFR